MSRPVGRSDAEIAVTYVLDGAVDEDAVVRCIAAVAQAMHRPMPQRQGEEACWFADGRPVAQVVSVWTIRDRDRLAAAALRAPDVLPAAALANRHDPPKALLFAIVDALEGPAPPLKPA